MRPRITHPPAKPWLSSHSRPLSHRPLRPKGRSVVRLPVRHCVLRRSSPRYALQASWAPSCAIMSLLPALPWPPRPRCQTARPLRVQTAPSLWRAEAHRSQLLSLQMLAFASACPLAQINSPQGGAYAGSLESLQPLRLHGL
jgi:hypothetical protein